MDILSTIVRRLLSVKSIVTLVLTAVFAYLSVTVDIPQDFMNVYVVVISFYFGTQAEKLAGGVKK